MKDKVKPERICNKLTKYFKSIWNFSYIFQLNDKKTKYNLSTADNLLQMRCKPLAGNGLIQTIGFLHSKTVIVRKNVPSGMCPGLY